MVLDRGKRGHFSRFFIFFDRKEPVKLILGLENLFLLVSVNVGDKITYFEPQS